MSTADAKCRWRARAPALSSGGPGTHHWMSTLCLIGYWRSDHDAAWLDLRDLVDEEWDAWERRRVWSYFGNGTLARAYRGVSPCRFCGEHNGSREGGGSPASLA